MTQEWARSFAPASVSNVACGFDIMGFAIAELGDVVSACRRESPGVEIVAISGDDGRLPREPEKNTAGVAAQSVLDRADVDWGVRLRIEKQMPLESGLGSSAASAVAAAVATSRLLDEPLETTDVLQAAIDGEMIASGSAHADNVAPSLFGGLVLIRSLDPAPDVIQLPIPDGLSCALIRPHASVNTLEARNRLGDSVTLKSAVRQWGNAAALVAGLYERDLGLVSRALVDHVAEPVRAELVPGFAAAKVAAREAGALGCSISGSGPSVFALCADLDEATQCAEHMARAVSEQEDVECDTLACRLGTAGALASSSLVGAPS